jgi:hypothetical protein
VYKQIGKRLKPFVKKNGNQTLIARAALSKFYPPDETTEVEQVEQLDSTSKNNDFQSEVEQVEQPDSTNSSERLTQHEHDLEDQIQELQKQLKEILIAEQEEKQFLKEQIRQKDKQIESLTDSLKMAQQLAAADKKKVLELEAKQQEYIYTEKNVSVKPEEDSVETNSLNAAQDKQHEKRGFFARLFGL